ncbi:MAG: T9SS type A sorting domain-containing protein [Bacteroidota bacterium]|nr:T9SS type A sorting domain-containing protein [Bacteroidota bacterium]MDP4233651.1 T9SS type A sorting domain-containing protein [Bacteroidota bacterium]MDP4243089.1 T9SS type A sorting domain-containing protein [Bacteroidota bacterium]MDP4288465.1 T9SS type A sorting domain-containing protein [Bacteroidota bacterium]
MIASLRIKRLILSILVLVCTMSFSANIARAQADSLENGLGGPEWMMCGGTGLTKNFISQFDKEWKVTAFYFFDATHGLAALTPGIPTDTIYYLSKRGKWTHSTMPSGIAMVRKIRFIQGKLYAATEQDVLVSSDSGVHWQYSGLHLNNANDIYADAAGNIQCLKDPMQTFARLDTTHCIATGSGSIYYSSDGGRTWMSIVNGIDPSSAGAFADRCKSVYLCPNAWGTVFRSTDLGLTWRTVPTGSGPFPEWLTGASTTAYISDTGGLYRTTDDGLTWKSIITVLNGPHLLYPFGPMGEHAAMSVLRQVGAWGVYREIWMTFTGGDDMLHSGPNMTDSNGAPLMQQDTFNIPLELTSMCNAMRIPIPFWSDVDSMSEQISIASDSLGDFSLLGPTSTVLTKQAADTFWLAYNPHHPVSNVVLKFDNHWQCSDWSETRTVHVVTIPTALIAPPRTFAGSCRLDTEVALITLDSCETLAIDSVWITDSIASRFRLVSAIPDTARMLYHDSLLFAFDPTGIVGNISDSITIFGHYLGLDSTLNNYYYFPHASGVDTNFGFFYRRIPIRLSALPRLAVLTSDSVLSFGTVYVCQQRDTTITLYNPGCDTVIVFGDSIGAKNGNFVTDTSYPFVLPGGSSAKVRITAIPDTTRHPASISAALLFRTNADSAFQPIPLRASIVYPEPFSIVLSHPDNVKPGQTVTVYVVLRHRSAALRPFTAIHFDLTHNDDFLSFAGIGLMPTSTTGDPTAEVQHFNLTPLPASDTVGILTFKVYLASMQTTTLQLSNVTFENQTGLLPACIASIDTSGSNFVLISACGFGPMGEVMSQGAFTIDDIRPNPANDKLEVHVVGAVEDGENATFHAEMYDVLGRAAVPAQDAHGTALQIDVSTLPGGAYYLRISNGGFSASRRVQIIH